MMKGSNKHSVRGEERRGEERIEREEYK